MKVRGLTKKSVKIIKMKEFFEKTKNEKVLCFSSI